MFEMGSVLTQEQNDQNSVGVEMSMKIVVVGGVAGGASTAARLRRNGEKDQIILLERGEHVSFSNCSLPYYLSGIVREADDLVLMNPEIFQAQYNIEARIKSEVTQIDSVEKKITIHDTAADKVYTETYDRLILSPGASPIVPRISGIEGVDVYTVRNVNDIVKLKQAAGDDYSKQIAVIGGGFIGIEVAENLREAGYPVTIIEALPQVLRIFDYDMVQIFHKVLLEHGISVRLGDKVEKFEGKEIVLASGNKVHADLVVMAIGVAPETGLAKLAGLQIGETGAIAVNEFYQTSIADIYAIGDAVEVDHALTKSKTKLSLAGPALKEARTAADHIHDKATLNRGFIGSSAIKVFEYNGAVTGLSESLIELMSERPDYEIVRISPSDKVGIMPDASPVHLKLLFEKQSGKILGAQAIGRGEVTKRIDVIATVIKFGGTLEDLKDLELCYAPPFSTAKDVVNYAGYVGSNLLQGDFHQIQVSQVRELVEKGQYFLDVRERGEYENGHIIGAVNIPLSELRSHLQAIPKDKPVYVHCRTGQRSYNAVLALQQEGFENMWNVAGSFLGLSFYEYFNDKVTGRKPILTNYNFW